MRIPLSVFSADTIEGYNLDNIVCSEGYIYIKIKKSLYIPSLPILNNELTNIVQQKTGSILYYGRAIDYSMLPALTEIA